MVWSSEIGANRLRCLRCLSANSHLLILQFRIPPEARMSVCCECCVLPCRGLCDELITRTEESYRLWCVFVCDLETSRMRRCWVAAPLEKRKLENSGKTDNLTKVQTRWPNDTWQNSKLALWKEMLDNTAVEEQDERPFGESKEMW